MGVPVTNLPSQVVSEILATATDLAGDATNIPITAVPSSVLSSVGGLVTGIPVGDLPSSIVSSVLATATDLPIDASNIPITALPTEIQASLTVVPSVTQVPTSVIPEGALTSIIGSLGTDLLPTAVPTSNLDPGVLSSIIASATELPPNPSEIPVSLIPSDATVSLNPTVLPTSVLPNDIISSVISQATAAPSLIVSAAPSAVPTSLVPEDVISSIIQASPSELLPSIIPTSALDPDLVSSVLATATNLAPTATGIPIGDLPTTAVVSFDPTAVPTSLLPTAIDPLDLCPCASLVLQAQAAGMIPLPVVTGVVSASAGVALGARDLDQQPAVAQATEEPCPFAEQTL